MPLLSRLPVDATAAPLWRRSLSFEIFIPPAISLEPRERLLNGTENNGDEHFVFRRWGGGIDDGGCSFSCPDGGEDDGIIVTAI